MPRVERLAEEIAGGRYRSARSLFLRRGERPPTLLWSPREDELPVPALGRALRWWAGLPRLEGVPAADPPSLVRVGAEIAHLTIVEPADLDCDRGDPGGAPEHAHLAVFTAAVCRAVVLRREPIYTAHDAPKTPARRSDRLILPLAGQSGAVAQLLLVTEPETPLRGLLGALMDPVLVFDEAGRIRLVNGPAATLIGAGEGELVDRPITAVLRAGFIVAGIRAGRVVTPTRRTTLRRADGSACPVEVSVGELRWDQRLFVAVMRDLTARKAEEERFRVLALTDPLTGLANRVLFQDRFAQAIRRALRNRDHLAVLMIDLDGFKEVNDRHGHPAGDAVLGEFARRIRSLVRQVDVLARLGGDEFALVQTDLGRPDDVAHAAERLLTLIGRPFLVGGREITIGASIGVAVYPDDADSAQTLLEHADRALYAAKSQGGHRWVRYRDLPPG